MSDDAIEIEINGRTLPARKGQMIIQAADEAGIVVPRFCYHSKLPVAANCRMCLVEVERAPKPMPACATPVADGMKVFTKSEKALDAQRAVMEFLLINHPLDCPICDEGGECQLQDTALGFGHVESRYTEDKRVVNDQYIGPLIQTEMTRCIHCTRCVRFGKEIGGIKEMGATGRGEHMRIGTYIADSVESELSGNMVDICPVGALTSKPYRYTARAWELQRQPSIAAHDCLGSHVEVDALRQQVKRVIPRENESLNECWLSDRDRYSYLGLYAEDRLGRPQIRAEDGQWRDVDWQEALARTAEILRGVCEHDAAVDALGMLVSPQLTTEELYLAQKLLRALGGASIDHRLHQSDDAVTADMPRHPGLADIAGLERADAVLLIGSNIRKDQPLIAQRLRKAAKAGAAIFQLASMRHDLAMPLAGEQAGSPAAWVQALDGMLAGDVAEGSFEAAVLAALQGAERPRIILGDQALASPAYRALRARAQRLASQTGADLGELTRGPNGAGAWLAGAVPGRGPGGAEVAAGRGAARMLAEGLSAYVVVGAEPELEAADSAAAWRALCAARDVICLTAFATPAMREYASVLLPIVPYTETGGSYVNCEGRWQEFRPAVKPWQDARPGWKVLRVLGNVLELPGFEHNTESEVRAELNALIEAGAQVPPTEAELCAAPVADAGLQRLGDVSLYATDALVRRAGALQQRADALEAAAYVNAALAGKLGIEDGGAVRVQQGEQTLELPLRVNDRVPDGCVHVPPGLAGTASLGPAWGAVELSAGVPAAGGRT